MRTREDSLPFLPERRCPVQVLATAMEQPVDTAFPTLSPSDFRARLGHAQTPLLLDVRRPEKFAASPWLLPGAVHVAPEGVAAFAAGRAPQPVIVYCAYGHNLSEEATRLLRASGWDACALAGGIEGGEPGVDSDADIARWRATPLPRIRKRPDLGVTGERPSRWITRARPKIDRIACPWLVQRFIDRRAEFLYVPRDEVLAQARAREAVAYDIDGAPIGHVGEHCSFDALLAAFDLHDPALERLARIVRGADTGRPELAPESASLLAVSRGLSLLHADDHAMLAAALPVYDALYAACRAEVAR